MPHHPPQPIEKIISGKKHAHYFASVNTTYYQAYGQILGEAIIALNPINFAADEHRTSFTNTFELYDQEWGNGFVFDALPPINKWKRIDHIKTDTIHTTISRCYLPHGAYYELQRNRNSKPLYDDEDNASDAAPTADSLICERVFLILITAYQKPSSSHGREPIKGVEASRQRSGIGKEMPIAMPLPVFLWILLNKLQSKLLNIQTASQKQ